MSREILFRGKCIEDTCLKGLWLEGQILHDGVTGKYYIHMGNCLNESDNVGEEGLLQFFAYEVEPETVCQYTGLTDKNGRKIFEGDIVKHFNDTTIPSKFNIGVISWDKQGCKFCKCRRGSRGNDKFYLIDDKCEYEVIGNVFDKE